MEIYDSIFRIVLGNSVLLDYGDALDSPGISLDGGQIVDVVQLVRSLGVKTYSRGNEQHSIEWTIIEPESGDDDAVAIALDHAVNVPRSTAPLIIELARGEQWRIDSATVESWPVSNEGILSMRSYRVIGGEISATHAIDPLANWEVQEVFWENT